LGIAQYLKLMFQLSFNYPLILFQSETKIGRTILMTKVQTNPIKKAVIPVAGLGTRFLPATKSIPKEMLTIVDAPIIFYVVEEAIQAGIEEIILIQGRGKTAIEDFFDTSYELEDKLQKSNKLHLLDRLNHIRQKARVVSVRQHQALGLGHAVLCAEPLIGEKPFAVLLGDEVMLPKKNQSMNTLGQLCSHFQELQAPLVSVMEVPEEDVSKYGIAEFDEDLLLKAPTQVKKFTEKPKPSETKSRWALPGRYILTPAIFDIIRNSPPGALGEIQLTDAMNVLAQKIPFYAKPIESTRYDAGDKLGFLIANIELGLQHPEIQSDFRAYLHKTLPLLLKNENL
jgi:UTP--glucose-1-phosphate uridylyltransferase